MKANEIKILGKTSATYKQIYEWAKAKKADDCFFEFFPILVDYANRYGIDGVVAVAQAARETGFGKFPGNAVLDKTYHNTCGLKNYNGGNSYKAESHAKFDTWKIGAQAHIEHLALYAGVEGFPLDNPIDPRHFKFRFACAVTIEDLTGTWAEDPEYAKGIARLYNEIINFKTNDTVDEVTTDKSSDLLSELEEEIDEKNQMISKLLDENEELKKKNTHLMNIVQSVKIAVKDLE